MSSLMCGCTAGLSGSALTPKPEVSELDPLLDLSLPEEQELPFLTIGSTVRLTTGEDGMDGEKEDCVRILICESKVHVSYLETLFAVCLDGCSQVRELMEGVIKASKKA